MNLGIVTQRVRRNDGQGRVNYEIALEALRQGHNVTLVASEVDQVLLGHSHVQWIRIDVGKWPTQLLKDQVFALQTCVRTTCNLDEVDVLIANGFITWRTSEMNLVHFVHGAWLSSPLHPFRLRWSFRTLYQWGYTALNALL
jgi:hypothetical protein